MDRIKCLLKFDSVLLLVSHYNSQPSAIAWSYTHIENPEQSLYD